VDRGFKRFRRGAETPLSMVLGETAAGGNHVRARAAAAKTKSDLNAPIIEANDRRSLS
jgi:hypothetical protein